MRSYTEEEIEKMVEKFKLERGILTAEEARILEEERGIKVPPDKILRPPSADVPDDDRSESEGPNYSGWQI